MFEVYVLQSIEHGRYYIGYSSNHQKRLEEHNQGFVKSTKPYKPYKCIYVEKFETRGEAMKREKELKKMKNSSNFKNIINAGIAQG